MSKSESTPIYSSAQLILERAGMLTDSRPIVAGVSGGVDSMVMLHCLSRLGYAVHVVHINYHKRGVASDEDEALVKRYSTLLNASVATFDIWPQDLQVGNFQDAARNARHHIYREEMRRIEAQGIALGHNKLDRLETILMRILRGSAPSNWDGIEENKPPIVRPLLSSTREEIADLAQHNNIPWREDDTNASSHYARNLLRNELIPSLDTLLPGWKHNIERITEYGATYAQALDALIGVGTNSKSISISKLQSNPELLQQALIHRFLELNGISTSHSTIAEIVQLIDCQSGKFIELNQELAVFKESDSLVIDSLGSTEHVSIQLPKINSTTPPITTPIGTFYGAQNDSFAGSTLELRNPESPITLRTWNYGDRIQIELGGTKKISDLITDWKIPLRLKSSVFVLTLDETIIACIFAHTGYLVRHRTATDWRVDPTSSNSSPITLFLNH